MENNEPNTPETNLSPATGEPRRQGMDITVRPAPEYDANPLQQLPQSTSVDELVSESMNKFSMGGK